MPAKVNTRFVVILVSVLVLLAVGGVIAARFALQKSASDYLRLGDEASAAGDHAKAAGYYAVAVNKDQANVEIIKKWIAALEKTTPGTMQQYRDSYQKDLRLAVIGLAQADRASFESQRRNLDESYQVLTNFSGDLGGWEELASLAGETMNRFEGSETDRKRLGRYRGLAGGEVLRRKGRRTAEEFGAVRADLVAALEADPKDEEVALAIAGLGMLEAQDARDRAEGGKADEMVRDVQRTLTEHIRAQAPSPGAALRLYQIRFAESARSAPRGTTNGQIIEEIKPDLVRAVEAFEAMSPKQIDARQVLLLSVSGAELLEDIRPRVRTIIEKVEEAQAENSRFLRAYGEVLLNFGQLDQAVATFDKVRSIPRPPLSLRGLILEQDKALAASGQAEAMFVAWQRSDNVGERQRLAGRFKEYRDALAGMIGENDNRVAALDARARFIEGDMAGARALITKYNQDTARTDSLSVLLEAEVMRRLGNTGSARDAYLRVLALQPGNTRALLALGALEEEERDYENALVYLKQASERIPDNKALAERVGQLEQIVRGTDPVLTEMVRIERQHLSSAASRNLTAAIEDLNKLMTTSRDDPRVASMLATLLATDGKKNEAIAVADRGLAKAPDHAPLASLKRQLTADDPVQAQLDAVDKLVLTDVQKNLQRFEILMRLGRREQARPFLEAASRQEPENPSVVEYQFLEALATNNAAELDRLVGIAERRNLDQLNGVNFRVRRDLARVQSLRAEARSKEQAGDEVGAARQRSEAMDLLRGSRVTLRQITQADRTNLIAWRLLGAVDLELSEPASAVDSFSKAVAIRPGDVASIVGYLRSLMATGALDKALDFARKSEQAGGGSEEFRAIWLALESQGPGGDRNKALEVRRGIAQRQPENLQNRVELAQLLLNTRRFDEARSEIASIREMGGVAQAVGLEARLSVARGEPQKAIDAYVAYIESIPESERTIAPFVEAARLMTGINQMNAAMQFYQAGRQHQDPKTLPIDREVGDVLYGARAYAEAIKVYEQVLASGFKDDGDLVLARIVEGYLNIGQTDKAAEALAKVGDRANATSTMLLLNARIAAAQNDRAKTRRLLDQAVAADRNNPTVYVARADFNAVDPQLTRDVEADLNEALRLAPAFSPARVRLVQMYSSQGNQNEAIRQLREGVAADPLNDQMRISLIEALLAGGRNDEAALVVDDTLRLRPDDVQWMMRGANLMSQIRKPQRATELAQRAWDKTRDIIPAALYVQILLTNEPPDTRTALRVLEAPELNTEKSVDARLLRARVHLKAGNAARAFEDVSASLGMIDQTNPEMAQRFFAVLPNIYPETKDRVAAVDALDQARAFDGWMKLFASMTRLDDDASRPRGKTELAALYESDVIPQIKFVAARTLAAVAYREKAFEECVSWYRRALQHNDSDAEVNNNIAYTLASEMGRPEEALPFAEKAVSAAPENPLLLDTLGVVYLGVNRLEDADMALRRAWTRATQMGERVPILVHLGLVVARQGKKDELRAIVKLLDEAEAAVPGITKPYEDKLRQLRQAAE